MFHETINVILVIKIPLSAESVSVSHKIYGNKENAQDDSRICPQFSLEFLQFRGQKSRNTGRVSLVSVFKILLKNP